MTDKFQNKYRIPSARMAGWDYGSNALYFVTICTDNRMCCFGTIVNGEMVLSELGELPINIGPKSPTISLLPNWANLL